MNLSAKTTWVFVQLTRQQTFTTTFTRSLYEGKGEGDLENWLKGGGTRFLLSKGKCLRAGGYLYILWVDIFNPFLANVLFLNPLKTPKNVWFFGIFRGYQVLTRALLGPINGPLTEFANAFSQLSLG